jgi:hypothetical protein
MQSSQPLQILESIFTAPFTISISLFGFRMLFIIYKISILMPFVLLALSGVKLILRVDLSNLGRVKEVHFLFVRRYLLFNKILG